MSARRQAALYYARRNRRNRVADISLYRTVSLNPGGSILAPFRSQDYGAPITFRLKHNISEHTGLLFSFGGNLSLSVLNSTTYQVTIYGVNYNISANHLGNDTLVLSIIPGDSSFRVWDSCGLLFSADNVVFTNSVWGLGTDTLQADSSLLSKLSVYAYQFPLNYGLAGSDDTGNTDNDLLYNATAVYFKVGMKTPFLED